MDRHSHVPLHVSQKNVTCHGYVNSHLLRYKWYLLRVVWWKVNDTSEALTMRKDQAWPKQCTPVSWCCCVKRARAENTSWSLRAPATPGRVIHHLACSPGLKYQWENPGSARLRLVMPPLTPATLTWCCYLSQGTLQTAEVRGCAFPAPLPAAAEGRLSSPPSLHGSDDSETNTPGRAEKTLWKSHLRISTVLMFY